MSKYENQFDSINAICPYCKNEYQVESEDYSESIRVEECDECGKKYHIYQELSVEHNTEPDCRINGEKHNYEHYKGNYYICNVCGKMERLEVIEKDQDNIIN